MKKYIFFDFDDTIANSYPFNQQMFVDTFTRYYPDINEQLIRDVHLAGKGSSMHEQFQKIITDLELDLDPVKMVAENIMLNMQNIEKIELFKGFGGFAQSLIDEGKTLAVLTNRDKIFLNKVLARNHAQDYFKDVVSCADEGFEKPDPKCFLDLIAKYGGNKDEFIYFGDSPTDAKFAKAAGVDFLIIDHYLNEQNFYSLIRSVVD